MAFCIEAAPAAASHDSLDDVVFTTALSQIQITFS